MAASPARRVVRVNRKPAETPDPKRGRRFFLARDNSSHWYLVPAELHEIWDAWTELDEDDSDSWALPGPLQAAGCRRLNGNPSNVTFTDPVDD